jgi:hypothetical protein
MPAALVSLLVVVALLSTLLSPGSIAAMVPAGSGCIVFSGEGSHALAAVPGSGVRVGLLGTECYHLAGEVLNTLQKCGAVAEWDNARDCRLGCGLVDADSGVQAALGLAGEDGLHVGGVAGQTRCGGSRLARLGRGS